MPMLLTKLMAAGLGSGLANAFCADTADNQTASGTNQATAFETSTAFVRFTTVASGTGCLLDNGARGDSQYIVNAGANALSVYPHVGGTINQLGTNAAFSIPAGSWAAFDRYTDALWTANNNAATSTFTQSGTGGLTRTVSAKLQDFVSTADFNTRAQYDTQRATLTASIGVGGLDLTRTAGTVATSSVFLNNWGTTFTGDSGGASDVSGLYLYHDSNGANAVTQSIAGRFVAVSSGAGTVTTLRGVLGEVQMVGAGNVSGAICLSALFTLTSSGSVTTNVQGVRVASPVISGGGTIPAFEGMRVSDLGNAAITGDVFGFRAQPQTATNGGSRYGFYSELVSASGNWNFYAAGAALNFFNGRTLFGTATDDALNQIQIVSGNDSGAAIIATSNTLNTGEGGSLKAANKTTPAKWTQIGYDGTADMGYIKAIHAGTANKHLSIQPIAGTALLVGTVTYDGTSKLQVNGDIAFGTNTAKGAEAFASFISIKDSGGTARKLMVCA